jgi:hypothetical protein
MNNSHTGQTVLDFYKILPFNYYGSIEEQVKSITQQSPIEELYPPLKGLVTPCKNMLEIGGAGRLSNSLAYKEHSSSTGLGLTYKSRWTN